MKKILLIGFCFFIFFVAACNKNSTIQPKYNPCEKDTAQQQTKTVKVFEKCTITIPNSYSVSNDNGEEGSFLVIIHSKEQDVVLRKERFIDFEYDTLRFLSEESHCSDDYFIHDTAMQTTGFFQINSHTAGKFRNCVGIYYLKENDYYLKYLDVSFSEDKLKELQNILKTVKLQ